MTDGLALMLDGLSRGVIHGRLTGAGEEPPLVEMQPGETAPVPVKFDNAEGTWTFAIPVPAEALGDGVTVIRFVDTATGAILARHVLTAGAIVPGDILAELGDLRAELSLLKRAFLDFAADPPMRAAERPLVLAEARRVALRLLAEGKGEP